MKKTFIFIALAAVLLLSACGPAAQSTTIAQPTQSQSNASATTSSSTSTDATPSAQSGDKVNVQVTLGDNWVKSDITTFKVGVTYMFTITNTGRRAHNFSISHPAEKTTNAINAARANALLSISEDDLSPGTVKTVEYTFKDAAPAGTLEFACLIPMHYKMGQFLGIVVEP
jgi:uncharacterized cupredoxin-like copper-binding protein